jgi:hypothetical protein
MTRELQAIDVRPTSIVERSESSGSDEARTLILYLEQELANIEQLRNDELEQIELWKEEEMKRACNEADDALQESCRLESLVRSSKDGIQALRLERKQLIADHETLRCDLGEMRKEQRHLTVESVKLQAQRKEVLAYLEAETKRGIDWANVEHQYEEHMQDVQRMIQERESRTAMEARQKGVYCRGVLKIVELVGNCGEVVENQELTGLVRSADLMPSTPLYAA